MRHAAGTGGSSAPSTLSAFAALRDPTSRAYYDRKRAERKTHTGALLALARRRSDVLFAMLRDGAAYNPARALAASPRT